MIVTVVLITFALITLLAAVYFGQGRSLGDVEWHSLSSRLKPVPVTALLNLLDPAQQSYLERRLSKSQTARLRRKRTRVLYAYFRAIYYNAGVFARVAHAATQSDRPEIVKAGRELLELALFTRVRSLRALSVLAISLIVPGPVAGLLPVVRKYATAITWSSEISAALSQSKIPA